MTTNPQYWTIAGPFWTNIPVSSEVGQESTFDPTEGLLEGKIADRTLSEEPVDSHVGDELASLGESDSAFEDNVAPISDAHIDTDLHKITEGSQVDSKEVQRD